MNLNIKFWIWDEDDEEYPDDDTWDGDGGTYDGIYYPYV